MRIAFFCITPASEGGNTPIADVRQVLRRISAQSLDEFLRLNWKLVRNYDQNFGLSWQQAFRTTSKSDVEEYCRASDIKYEWRHGQQLRTSQIRPSTAIHPRTQEATWFNHISFWNVSALPLETKRMFLKEFTEEGLPYNTYYGDGTPIPEHVIREIAEAYDAETVQFQWQRGDLLLLDNMLAAHGRGSYKGNRKIIVSMGDPYKRP